MRFGLVGTGHWARVAHAPALAATADAEFTGVWGRDPARTAALAGEFGVRAYGSFDELLADVDAVEFSVPPDVQAGYATTAAAAGKHLLLEKPIAHDAAAGRALVDAAAASGVASAVFFTQLYRPEVRDWLASCRAAAAEHPWEGGTALTLGSVQREHGVFATPWRLERDGGLWDLGPHALSILLNVLAPVETVAAHEDPLGTVHLVLGHRGGASSTVGVSQNVPTAAGLSYARVWGGAGHAVVPDQHTTVVDALSTAITELTAAARPGAPAHPYGLEFGAQVLDVLVRAQDHLDHARHGEHMSSQ
ncbi:Gfo/Idh/MocA family protein [Jiangella alba]|uniref:Oxidoreductase family, NAD-binding Rossmann fold n=1 Tax=Jiangella alba TaxID=561176 RepID=A0A1H5MU31_9ACTN|nr:Gfo/Idh/MocA family oxidoreductase [Jiangella alba]SEE92796.1 Oxidoreductase family, NAD-binding Rossmann fold [Jiangella alba]